MAFSARKEWDKAVDDYKTAIKLRPDFAEGHNAFAWLRATCPNGKFRNEKEAVGAATKACELSGWKNPNFIDALAAAYAEAGKFGDAIKWQTKSIELGLPENELKQARKRLGLYEENRPYRDNQEK